MARTEKDFQMEMNLSFKIYFDNIKYYYYKIPDTGILQMYDAHLWWFPKNYAGIEYKMNKAKTTINMKNLFSDREHQIRNLKQRIEMGHQGWIIINHFIPKQTNRAFLISPDTAQKYIDKGTVKMEEFMKDEKVKELKREKHLGRFYWDFNCIL